VGAAGMPGVACSSPDMASFTANDIISDGGPAYYGCADATGSDGNISVSPAFIDVSTGDFHESAVSPTIDAGRMVSGLPSNDFDGSPRVVDGDGDMVAELDQGAYEFDPFAASPTPTSTSSPTTTYTSTATGSPTISRTST